MIVLFHVARSEKEAAKLHRDGCIIAQSTSAIRQTKPSFSEPQQVIAAQF